MVISRAQWAKGNLYGMATSGEWIVKVESQNVCHMEGGEGDVRNIVES